MLVGYFCQGKKKYFRHIPLLGPLQKDVCSEFESLRNSFFFPDEEELKVLPFTPSRLTENEAIAYVDHCKNIEEFWQEARTWNLLNPWNVQEDLANIKAVLLWNENSSEVLVQLIESRRVMLPKNNWFFSLGDHRTLEKTNHYALQLDNKLLAVIKLNNLGGKRLLFKSYFYAARIFDLSDFLLEATTETAKEMFKAPIFGLSEKQLDSIVQNLSKSQLKRIPQILALGYLSDNSAENLVKRASRTKSGFLLKEKEGKLLVPSDRKEMDKFLLFLSNRILSSYLDDKFDYESDSIRRIERDTTQTKI